MPDKIIRLLKSKILLILLPIITFFFLGWGYIGHSIINYNTILTALPEMSFFEYWADSLAAHGSDADDRKSIDPDEGPKHYIDIDNYPEFLSTGTIPQNFDSIVALHGYSFVIDQGILPWAILNTADSLQTAFENNNLHKAMLLAADLGHYIGDSHMPLHITRNYNGQYTDQYGVHSRYESGLIQRFQDQIIYGGDSLQYIDNLSDYVFNMIYDNYLYVDSVLGADAAAKAFAGNTNSTSYYNKFWELSKNFTIGLFKKASYRLTCVIYTAWINAGGSPSRISESNNNLLSDFTLYQNYPNPFNPSTKISWQSPIGSWQILKVFDVLGREVATLVDEYRDAGSYEVEFNLASSMKNPTSGIYFYQLKVGEFVEGKKMLLLK
jgi:hypothetical protein